MDCESGDNSDLCADPQEEKQQVTDASEPEIPVSKASTDHSNGPATPVLTRTRTSMRLKETVDSNSKSETKKNGNTTNGSVKTPKQVKQSAASSEPIVVKTVPERRLVVFPPTERIKLTRAQLLLIPEQHSGAEFGVGDIVWAKTFGFPFWPCLITTCPITGVYVKKDDSDDETQYHIQYFGSEAARGWAKSRNMMPFEGLEKFKALSNGSATPGSGTSGSGRKSRTKQNDKYAIDRKDKKKWDYAVAEATFAADLKVEARLSAFTFEYKIADENHVTDGRKRKSETPKTPSRNKKLKKSSGSPEDVFDFDEDEEPTTPITAAKGSPFVLSSAKKKGDLNVYKKREKPLLKKSNPKMNDAELEALLEKKWNLMDDAQRSKYVDRSDVDLKEKEKEPEPVARLSLGKKQKIMPKTPAILVAKPNSNSVKKTPAVKADVSEIKTPKRTPKSTATTPEVEKTPSTRPKRTPKGKATPATEVVVKFKAEPESKSAPNPLSSPKHNSDQESQADEIRSLGSTGSEEVISISDASSETGSDASKPQDVCYKCFEKIEPALEVVKCCGPCMRTYERKCIGLSETEPIDEWKCSECSSGKHTCFICAVTPAENEDQNTTVKCSDQTCGRYYHPACLKFHPHKLADDGTFTCPLHFCLTCHNDHYEDNVYRTVKRPLLQCIKCPTAYHLLDDCYAAGTMTVVDRKFVVCPEHREKKKSSRNKHINVSFCFACLEGGSLTCCDRCPAAFHAECLEADLKVDSEEFLCGSCLKRRQLRYGDIVWVKIGSFRWWPAKIVHPLKTPDNVMKMKWLTGQFPVKFLGTHDYNWTEQARAFPFEEEDLKPLTSTGSSKTDKDFKKALAEAKEEFKEYKANKTSALAKKMKTFPPYNRIRTNKAIGSVQLQDAENLTTNCECDPKSQAPCGPDSDCLNRMMMYECTSKNCSVGDKCGNRRFTKREYVKTKPFNTVQRGWGLKTLVDIKKGTFVIEYVGEIIDEEECNRRIEHKTKTNDSNFYFLTIDKDRIIDAGPSGNLARFMNHCCQPNCETQKWVVNGSTRVGLFAVEDIPAGTELTFNYNLDSRGKKKTVCTCGAEKCSGFL